MPVKSRTILIVDDDPLSLMSFREMLEADFHLLYLTDPNIALDMISHTAPDLLIVDISMLGLSGYEFVEQVRNRMSGPTIPVIFCSSLESGRLVAKAKDYENAVFVSKHANAANFYAALNALLKSSKRD